MLEALLLLTGLFVGWFIGVIMVTGAYETELKRGFVTCRDKAYRVTEVLP